MINLKNMFYEEKEMQDIMEEFYLIKRNIIIKHNFIISFLFLIKHNLIISRLRSV